MRSHISPLFSLLLILALACDLSGITPPGGGDIQTSVAGTLTALAGTSTGGPGLTPAAQTATATPPVEEPAVLRIVYTDNVNRFRGNLWIIEDGAAPRQLTFSGQDHSPLLSDDGRLVAFLRTVDPNLDASELWVVNSDGSGERALVTQAWLGGIRPGETSSLWRVAWVPGSQRLAFSTRAVFEGPGLLTNDDLYAVNAEDGSIIVLLPPGSNAAEFFYSPDGTKIALSSPDTIGLMNADGSGRRDLVTYAVINTASEFWYSVPVRWAPESTHFRAAIPSADPFAPDPTGTLWHIPADGSPAFSLATLSGNFYFISSDYHWYAPDLQKVAFLRSIGDPAGNVRELHIAGGDGSADSIYVTAPSIQWLGWAPDSQRFVYEFGDATYLGEIGAAPQPLFSDIARAFEPRWISNDQILFFLGGYGAWQLRLGAPGGTSGVIAAPAGDVVQFDFDR